MINKLLKLNYSKKEEKITLANQPKALKRFGQNYLVDQNIVRKIIAEFNPKQNERILEIGPGRGILTEHLANSSAEINAVEIDKRVIEELREKFPDVVFINEDFLKVDLGKLFHQNKFRIIGNIPYNITSQILFKLINSLEYVEDALFMVQYEVAKRIDSKPRTKDYGILGVILNYFFDVKFCFKVPATVFKPKPKVDSAIIKLTPRNIRQDFDKKLFIDIVKASFGNRRKNLKNSLSNSIFRVYDLSSFPVDLTKRAEELSIDDYLIIYDYFKVKKADERRN